MKTAILTGAASGIGQTIDAMLTDNDWRIIRLSHRSSSSDANEYVIDLSDLTAVAELGKRLKADLLQVDAFIHVAGIWHDDTHVLAGKQLEQFSPEQIIATMNVGLTSAMLLCRDLLPVMNGGTIIGISGTFADGAAGWLPYYTSKRGLEDFLVGLSQDYSQLKVYGISPADTATPAYAKFYPQYLAESQPPQAVAELVFKLLAGGSQFRSGEIIEIRQGQGRSAFHA